MKTSPLTKRHVFISYAHRDVRILRGIIDFLKKSQAPGTSFFIDDGITSGSLFNDTIRQNIDRSTHFLLFLSDYFLDSNYIRNFETPYVLRYHYEYGRPMVLVLVRDCKWRESFFSPFQIMPRTIGGQPRPLISFSLADRPMIASKIRATLFDDAATVQHLAGAGSFSLDAVLALSGRERAEFLSSHFFPTRSVDRAHRDGALPFQIARSISSAQGKKAVDYANEMIDSVLELRIGNLDRSMAYGINFLPDPDRDKDTYIELAFDIAAKKGSLSLACLLTSFAMIIPSQEGRICNALDLLEK